MTAMRIYLASLSACQTSEDLLDPTKQATLMIHTPVLLIADTMENAAASLRIQSLDNWKTEEGWFNHSATIVPFKSRFIDETLGLVGQGVITLADDPHGEQRFFSFDPQNPGTDIQDETLSDSN